MPIAPCGSCAESCCRDYLVTVTGLDVFRISQGVGLAPQEFAVAIEFDPTHHGFRLDTGDTRYRLALDKQRAVDRAGWCTFWLPVGSAAGRCGIYEHRPQVCRTYPATLRDGAVVRRADVLCPDGAWGSGSDLFGALWRRRTEQQYAELEVDALVNQWWNTEVEPLATTQLTGQRYVDWLLDVYGRLDPQLTSTVTWARPERSTLAQVYAALEGATGPA